MRPNHQPADLEDAACLRLGRFLFAFAYLEVNLALCLNAAIRHLPADHDVAQTPVQRPFASSLDLLLQVISSTLDPSTPGYAAWVAWYMRADAIRETRNSFAHSRWITLWHQQVMVTVTGVPGQTPQQVEQRLTLDEMDSLIREAKVLLLNLSNLGRKHPIE
jgi:hypothetical protein